MFQEEIEELNKAIKHLENDILPSKCNGNIFCYNEHTQLYKWLKELKSYFVNESNLERKIEELEKNIKLKNKQLRAGFEAQIENIDLKEQIKTMKKYLDCDFCEYQNNKDECHQCNYLEKSGWTLKKEIKNEL